VCQSIEGAARPLFTPVSGGFHRASATIFCQGDAQIGCGICVGPAIWLPYRKD